MRLTRRQLLRLAAGTAALAALLRIANAQAYPIRPVRLIGAGAATEILARQIANDPADAVGQPIVVEDRQGASGYIAWNHPANAEPSGQTLLLAATALAMSQALYKKAASAFDPLTPCDAVAALAASPSALILSKTATANTVAELVAYSRTVPGTTNYASAGVGSRCPLELRGVQGRRRHGGDPHSLQGRRPRHRGCGGRPHPDDDHLCSDGKKPGRVGPAQGPGGDEAHTLTGNAGNSNHARGWGEEARCGFAVLVRPVRPQRPDRCCQGHARRCGHER
jgi:Tripartite tricarboxylate transporter family receptor